MLLHLPVNHRYRAAYRFLAALTGLYVLAFGIVGVAVSRGHDVVSREHLSALGLRTNLAFAILSIVVGVIVLVGVVVGRNWDHILNLGLVLLAAGLYSRAGSAADTEAVEQDRHRTAPVSGRAG